MKTSRSSTAAALHSAALNLTVDGRLLAPPAAAEEEEEEGAATAAEAEAEALLMSRDRYDLT